MEILSLPVWVEWNYMNSRKCNFPPIIREAQEKSIILYWFPRSIHVNSYAFVIIFSSSIFVCNLWMIVCMHAGIIELCDYAALKRQIAYYCILYLCTYMHIHFYICKYTQHNTLILMHNYLNIYIFIGP